jgi:hypothetical protein
MGALLGLFGVSDPCCVKKGNKYSSFILILFLLEKRESFFEIPIFEQLAKVTITIICYSGFKKQNEKIPVFRVSL